jgi:D-alanyl-D-alanine carboxypeptidase
MVTAMLQGLAIAFRSALRRPVVTCAPRAHWTVFLAVAIITATTVAADDTAHDLGRRLISAYPGIVTSADATTLTFKDGTTLPLDDRGAHKPFSAWLSDPDIEDMMRFPYPAGAPLQPPARDVDPGRARNAAFFTKVYGDCRKGEVVKNLVDVVWLPKKSGVRLQITRINGVAGKLQAISEALDKLPAHFDVYLTPPAGTYNCRPIAGTSSLSAHGYGIAIDIATARADYWRWNASATKAHTYRNAIPAEIVAIFEAHGFIWGGRWYHYDTMHFEYRPELLSPTKGVPDPTGATSSEKPATETASEKVGGPK